MRYLVVTVAIIASTLGCWTEATAANLSYKSNILNFHYPTGWTLQSKTLNNKFAAVRLVTVKGPLLSLCSVTHYSKALDGPKTSARLVKRLKASARISSFKTVEHTDQFAGVTAHGFKISYSVKNVSHKATVLTAVRDGRMLIFFSQKPTGHSGNAEGCTLVRTSLRLSVPKKLPGPAPKKKKDSGVPEKKQSPPSKSPAKR